MDKNAIKKYAVWAREELIKRVSAKATQYGITKEDIADASTDTINGVLLTSSEKKQRNDLISAVKTKGYEQVIEEVAYTWFNRFIALRFMEVNNYLPTHIRVFTDEENSFNPQIMAEAIHLELDGLDKAKVLELKEQNKNDELYKYLLITQCNALNSILPQMFQRISDYTELLFPDNILRDGSVIQQLVAEIPEEDFKDAVQIIGWLYQYYNSVPKDTVFANLKKNIKIKKEDIPAATQLFTPDWIVRYMVENSLGRLWVEKLQATEKGYHYNYNEDGTEKNAYTVMPQTIASLKSNWKYYLDEAEQEPDVQAQLTKIREEYKDMQPGDIKCIDPCMGSGHILVYMFDVLMQIYESYGYNSRDAAASIVQNNLYGLDIDDRAAQLAYFAVMMKARAYDRRFFSRDIQPHIYAIPDYLDWKEYGTLTIIDEMPQRPKQEEGQLSLDSINYDFLNHVVDVAEVLTQKYDVVITNPPYMSNKGMSAKLSDFVQKNYPDSKSDLFAVFIEKCKEMLRNNGYQAMITQHAFMFLSSYEKLRKKLLLIDTISMAHLGARAFEEIGGEVVQTTTWVQRNNNVKAYKGKYCRLVEPTTQQGKENMFLAKENRFATLKENFSKIPGSPIAYWVSVNAFEICASEKTFENYATTRAGMITGNNNIFIRLWHEISNTKLGLNHRNRESAKDSGMTWFPYNKGGEFRKWFGNNEYVVHWENDGYFMRNFKDEKGKIPAHAFNLDYIFKENVTWSSLSSYKFAARYTDYGFLYDASGSFADVQTENVKYTLALLCSEITFYFLSAMNPTLNFQKGNIGSLPFIIDKDVKSDIDIIVDENIALSKNDWDSFETSWDFTFHPLLNYGVSISSGLGDGYSQSINFEVNKSENSLLVLEKDKPKNISIQSAFEMWSDACEKQFNKLKANEEELNRMFITIYGLQDELTPEVEDKDVTVRKADLKRDIKSFISYAVGCMFGRYSLDVDGLAYAGGEFDSGKYTTYPADADNIIPICDDEYFEDDIVGRFVKFVETVYGAETLEENLKFIADAIGTKGQPKEVIRNYFLNDFFADHCKIYQKRPIYWLFDSGKKNGFKALVYMHRYQADTIARMRTDYVHEQQGRYRTAIADLEHRINDATTAERVKLTKQLTTLKDQDTELRTYEEKIHHLADQMISIDLDDGVKNNYEILKDVLAKIK